MESSEYSLLSSLRGEFKPEDYIQPHYRESYRIAIDHLVNDGRDRYLDFLKAERVGSFLSDEELAFITANAKQLPPQNHSEEISDALDNKSSSGTYWPLNSDVDTPDLDMGWPEVMHEKLQTNIDVLFHPPRQNSPTIKEVIRKHIQEARQVIAVVMDMFTDVDIFKEIVDACSRGVPVYVLLDDYHLKSFLTMAENQDVKIQQLRNMRVRTVKGEDYLCRSGAKFHGAMEQKFLLIDCHTTIYGSYSFTWSCEKINLSMVQVIKGHLVKSYDEEFRTLYARSTVPVELSPSEGLFQPNGLHGRQVLSKCSQLIDRRDQLRHTLDTVYRKTCERNLGMRDIEEESNNLRPVMENGIGLQNQLSPYQSEEMMNFMKRHSYAGERQDGYIPQNMRPRASNWNIPRETANYPTDNYLDNYSQVPQIYRGQNMRQSYNGNDKQVLSMQQKMPTLENTSKQFMRTWRIESYLKNPDVPLGDSCDYLDQFESQDKASAFMQGRMRSSLVLRSTIPEQMEPNRHMNNTTSGVNLSTTANTPMHYSSMQWNPNADSRANNEEFMMKRRSMQLLDDSRSNASMDPGRNYLSVYSSLGRAKGGPITTNPDVTDMYKRHSVADPRSNSEYAHESSSHMYGAFARMQVNRSTVGINAQNGGYGSKMNEDQRSISHYDVKSIKSTNSPSTSIWQEPPSRTTSAVTLDANGRDSTGKSNSMGSPHFLKTSSKKIKSFLNIPEKKEPSSTTIETPSVTSETSTDTITAEDEERIAGGGVRRPQTTSSPPRYASDQQRSHLVEEPTSHSKPRFRTEEQQHQPQVSTTQSVTKSAKFGDGASSGKDGRSDNRVYSRYESLCSLDRKQPLRSTHTFGSSQEKSKIVTKGMAAIEPSFGRSIRGHENKIGKFFHRVGNLIHKNK